MLFLSLILNLMLSSCTRDNDNEFTEDQYGKQKEILFSKLINIQEGKEKSDQHRVSSQYTEDEKTSLLYTSIQVLNSKGVTNDMIAYEFGNLENPEIVLSALAFTRIVDETAAENNIIDLETGFNYSTNSYVNNNVDRSGSVVDCALGALGIPAGLIVGSAGSTSTKALLKAARKLATRMLGWVGAAIAIYDFGNCMEWW